jgi:tetratricopeptide (TPR) repeat protein
MEQRRHFRAFRSTLAVFTIVAGAARSGAGQPPNPHAAEIHDHLEKAAAFLRAKDADSAVRQLDAVLALDPRNAEAYADLGVIAFFKQDFRAAARDLRQALAINPSLAKSQALLGICERRLGDPSAQSILESAFPRLKDKDLRIQTGLELANIYYQAGDLDRAAAAMRSLVDLAPDNVEVLFMAQRVYYELADETLNKLSIVAPGSARMQQVIAERLVNDGNLKDAIGYYRRALQIDPNLPGVHYELAEAIFESAPNDAQAQAQAEAELQAAMNLEGDSSQIECMLGRIARKQSDPGAAYAHYRRAFALAPSDAEAELGLGQSLADMHQPEKALRYLRLAVQSDPLNQEAHYRLAVVCRTLHLSAESQKEFRLFREVKEAQAHTRELYRQMNRTAPESQLDDLSGNKDSLPQR